MFQSDPRKLVDQLLAADRRVLLFGKPGIGKTTLTTALAKTLSADRRLVWALSSDPGLPAFGPPGAVSLGRWQDSAWEVERTEALCTLDAARFRLPLISAVRALAGEVTEGTLLLDPPGVVRGVAGAEMLTELLQVAAIDLVIVLLRDGDTAPLHTELQVPGLELVSVSAAEAACQPSKIRRGRCRTQVWDRYLEPATLQRCSLDQLRIIGTPPRKAPEAWVGKQVAFLASGRTRTMGEVVEMTDETLTIRLPTGNRVSDVLLIRDAGRNSQGLLSRSRPFAESVVHYLPPSDMLPDASIKTEDGIRPLVHMGTAMATLMNGVFGDPLLHLRLRHQRRSLLFDLGDGARLPARIAHQVSDVFVSHAHVDHISGFLWLLRSRIGLKVACRLYGPAGLAGHIEGLLAGICWDRIGDRGPVFEVAELADNRLQWYRLQAGMAGRQQLGVEEIQGGVLLDEPGFQVRTAVLDHGIPVLAFAYEPKLQLNIRKERLRAQHLPPGPWLTRLKQHILRGDLDRLLQLPDGGCQTVATLADSLVLMRRGSKLVFATDFGDTADNRQRLTRLAKEAHVFFCEATFMQKHAAQAARTGHLTTAACARIANQAAVQYLVPFHFSRRYEKQPWQLYDEIAALTSRVVIPKQSEWSRMRENGS